MTFQTIQTLDTVVQLMDYLFFLDPVLEWLNGVQQPAEYLTPVI